MGGVQEGQGSLHKNILAIHTLLHHYFNIKIKDLGILCVSTGVLTKPASTRPINCQFLLRLKSLTDFCCVFYKVQHSLFTHSPPATWHMRSIPISVLGTALWSIVIKYRCSQKTCRWGNFEASLSSVFKVCKVPWIETERSLLWCFTVYLLWLMREIQCRPVRWFQIDEPLEWIGFQPSVGFSPKPPISQSSLKEPCSSNFKQELVWHRSERTNIVIYLFFLPWFVSG